MLLSRTRFDFLGVPSSVLTSHFSRSRNVCLIAVVVARRRKPLVFNKAID